MVADSLMPHHVHSIVNHTALRKVRGASFVMNYQIYKEEILMVEGEITLLAMENISLKLRRLTTSFKKAMAEFEAEKTVS